MSNDTTAGTPPTPPAPPAPPRQPTRPKASEADAIADARHVLSAVRKNIADFIRADKDRAVKRIDTKWVGGYAALLARAVRARGAQRPKAVVAAGATAKETAAREALYAAAAKIRSDIATSYPDPEDDEIRLAFGVGAKVSTSVTEDVQTFAEGIAEAFENEEWQPRAIDAGVTAKVIAHLATLQNTLADFGTTQNAKYASKSSATLEKDAILQELRAKTAYARQVAKSVYKDKPSKLKLFARQTPRVTPQKKGTTPTGGKKKSKKRPRVAVKKPRGGKKTK